MAAHAPGVVYLLHFTRPYKHARHYMGWVHGSGFLAARLAEHTAGRGARLVQVVIEAGIGFELARLWPGDRALERTLKGRRMAPRYCLICRAERAGRPRPPALATTPATA